LTAIEGADNIVLLEFCILLVLVGVAIFGIGMYNLGRDNPAYQNKLNKGVIYKNIACVADHILVVAPQKDLTKEVFRRLEGDCPPELFVVVEDGKFVAYAPTTSTPEDSK